MSKKVIVERRKHSCPFQLTPEEELEKQYREYKAQFEQWREKNRSSEGTEGYIQYVRQFEKWERDVEARRKSVRAKAEQDRRQAAAAAVHEEAKQVSEEDAAARYAAQHQPYMAMHARAMQEEERQRQKQRVAEPVAVHHQQVSHIEEAIKRGPHIQAEPQPTTAHITVEHDQRSPLWGPDGAEYTSADPMFARWGLRAAPPNCKATYQPPPLDAPITPSWYLMKKMEEKGLFYGYNVNLGGTAEINLDGLPDIMNGNGVRRDGQNGDGQAYPPPPFNPATDVGFMPSSTTQVVFAPPPEAIYRQAPVVVNVPPPPSDFSIPPPPVDFSVPPPIVLAP